MPKPGASALFSFIFYLKRSASTVREPIFTGSGVAIVTPFTHETVDLNALGRLLDFQLENGTDAVIVCGTTGEASTMSYRERMRTIEFCVEHVDGRVPVIAGSGSNSTENAIALSRDAERAGADALLVVTPLLQQSLADRPSASLQRHCRYSGCTAHSLRRSLPHRRHHCAGNLRGAFQASKHQRRQGGRRQSWGHSKNQKPVSGGLFHLVGQR